MHTPTGPADPDATRSPLRGVLGWYERVPLYLRILIALALGVVAGFAMGKSAARLEPLYAIVLRLLGALATPLIFVAVVHALVKADIRGGMAARMLFLLMFNTVVAILVGLFVANTVQPGL